jgi:hypothetical protein
MANLDPQGRAGEPSGPRGAGNGDKSGKTDFSGLGATLGIAATLIVAVFAALGVSGNLLARMVRNDPQASKNILWLAIAMVVFAGVITALSTRANSWLAAPVFGLGVALVLAANAAAVSQEKRENPSISLSLSRTQSGSGGLTLTAKATGSSLKSNDRLLLRVAAVIRRLAVKEMAGPKANERTTELRDVTNRECKRSELHPVNVKDARLLSWTETGSNVSGEATTEQTMPIPSQAQYVCAWAILSPRPADPLGNAPEDFALVDLADIRG